MPAELVRGPHPGITLNEHYVGHGDIVYRQACKRGCEGVVSKRLSSPRSHPRLEGANSGALGDYARSPRRRACAGVPAWPHAAAL